jgi:hypothetical protein
MYRHACFLAFIVVALGGCASIKPMAQPTNGLEKALQFREIGRDGRAYDLSRSSSGVFGVPNGAEVDINSTIEVHLKKDEVQLPLKPESAPAPGYSKEKARSIQEALELLAKVIEARTATAKAYQDTEAFLAARDISNPLSRKFSNLPLWEDGTLSASVDEINAAVINDKTYRLLAPILQKELDAMGDSLNQAAAAAKSNAAVFRMTAFIQAPNGDPAVIHLPNYDSLDQRQINFKDAFMADKQDLDRLKTQWQQTKDVARAAEDLRAKKISMNEALKESGLRQISALQDIAVQVNALAREPWPSIVRGLGSDMKKAADLIGSIGKQREDKILTEISQRLDAADASVLAEMPIDDLKGTLAKIKALAADWQAATPDSLPDLITRTQTTISGAAALDAKISAVNIDELRKISVDLLALVREKPHDLSPEAWAAVTDSLDQAGVLARIKVAASILATLESLHKNLEAMKSFFAQNKPVAIDLHAASLDVSWADASDTRIELPRTSRAIGDQVHLNAELVVDGKVSSKSDTSFTIEQFGWHKEITPSVILAKPIRTTSAFDHNFRFAPAVSWLATYYPRPAENAVWDRVARFSEVGFGLHAAFLNQDAQSSEQIGLGVAISVWRDYLTAGIGWNLMSDSRPYYYIGTNLIPLLQALGYGKGAQAGKTQ